MIPVSCLGVMLLKWVIRVQFRTVLDNHWCEELLDIQEMVMYGKIHVIEIKLINYQLTSLEDLKVREYWYVIANVIFRNFSYYVGNDMAFANYYFM